MSIHPPIAGTPAEIYEQHMVPAIFVHWAPDLVKAAGVQPGGRALDVACGTGVVTRILAARVGPAGTVVGLDINPGMLAVARVAAPLPNIEWIEGSAISMTLPDATFDNVLCEQGLQFFPDKPAALAEMRRVLKPGGRLALSCWCSVEYMPGYLEQGAGVLDAIVAEVDAATRRVRGRRGLGHPRGEPHRHGKRMTSRRLPQVRGPRRWRRSPACQPTRFPTTSARDNKRHRLTQDWSRLPEAPAALPLPAAPDARR